MKKILAVCVLLLSLMQSALAVVNANGGVNTNVTAVIANCVGSLNNVTAIVVDNDWIIAAKHANAQVGDLFILKGVTNSLIYKTNHLNSSTDLAMFKLSGSLPNSNILPLYTGNACGKTVTSVGRGLPPGEQVMVPVTFTITDLVHNSTNDSFKVWGVNGSSFTVQWSTNMTAWVSLPETYTLDYFDPLANYKEVSIPLNSEPMIRFYRTVSQSPAFIMNGWKYGPPQIPVFTQGTMLIETTQENGLYRSFFKNGASCITLNDSSGAMAIYDGGKWKLAGINYSSSGCQPYSCDGGKTFISGGTFTNMAGMTLGYLVQGAQGVTFVPSYTFSINIEIPQTCKYTPIQGNLTWIQGVISGN